MEKVKVPKKNSQMREVWGRLRKNTRAMISLSFIILLFATAAGADIPCDYQGQAIAQNMMGRFAAPGAEHWFGTDSYGRDIFARIVHGTRISIPLGFGATSISIFFATLIGTTSAYYGGAVDNVITRVWYKGTTRNFNLPMATSADLVIAEAEHLVREGGIAPENVHTYGVFVDYIVEGGDEEKNG